MTDAEAAYKRTLSRMTSSEKRRSRCDRAGCFEWIVIPIVTTGASSTSYIAQTLTPTKR